MNRHVAADVRRRVLPSPLCPPPYVGGYGSWAQGAEEVLRVLLMALALVAFIPCHSYALQAPGVVKPASSRAATAAATNNSSDAVFFRNGDVLNGTLHSIEPQGLVRWQHSDVAELIEFIPGTMSEIHFGPRTLPPASLTNDCQVRLTNGDALEGNLILCDTEKIVLETWYAGRIEIPRKRVEHIIPKPAERPPLFEGPTGPEGWTMGKALTNLQSAAEWKYKNGAFYATRSASAARDVKLPDVASIQFDVAWKGMLNMAIALYSDYLYPINLIARETEPDFGGFYSLQLNNYAVNVYVVTKHDPLRNLGQTSIPLFNQKSKAHIEIRVNKPKRVIALFADGILVKQWIDAEDFVGKGTALRFVHQQGVGAAKLSHIRISEWDGQFDEKPAPNPNSPLDVARLQNGDRATGALQSIRDGKVSFTVSGRSPLEIPVQRVKLIELAGQKAERPSEDAADIRVWFRRGGFVTFRLEKWDEREIVGSSANFGRATFNPLAFERVEFKPASPAKTTADIQGRRSLDRYSMNPRPIGWPIGQQGFNGQAQPFIGDPQIRMQVIRQQLQLDNQIPRQLIERNLLDRLKRQIGPAIQF